MYMNGKKNKYPIINERYTNIYIYTLVLQILSEKVFGTQKPSPNTVSEGVWSYKDIIYHIIYTYIIYYDNMIL